MKKRPIGLTIIAAISIISGISLLASQFYRLFSSTVIDSSIITSTVVVKPLLIASALIYIISGIGIILAKKWAWILGIFNYGLEILKNIAGFFYFATVYSGIVEINMIIPTIAFLVWIIFLTIIVIYLLSQGVLEYFEVSNKEKKYYLIRIVSIVIIFGILNVSAAYILD